LELETYPFPVHRFLRDEVEVAFEDALQAAGAPAAHGVADERRGLFAVAADDDDGVRRGLGGERALGLLTERVRGVARGLVGLADDADVARVERKGFSSCAVSKTCVPDSGAESCKRRSPRRRLERAVLTRRRAAAVVVARRRPLLEQLEAHPPTLGPALVHPREACARSFAARAVCARLARGRDEQEGVARLAFAKSAARRVEQVELLRDAADEVGRQTPSVAAQAREERARRVQSRLDLSMYSIAPSTEKRAGEDQKSPDCISRSASALRVTHASSSTCAATSSYFS
jgi:hypothetical protein